MNLTMASTSSRHQRGQTGMNSVDVQVTRKNYELVGSPTEPFTCSCGGAHGFVAACPAGGTTTAGRGDRRGSVTSKSDANNQVGFPPEHAPKQPSITLTDAILGRMGIRSATAGEARNGNGFELVNEPTTSSDATETAARTQPAAGAEQSTGAATTKSSVGAVSAVPGPAHVFRLPLGHANAKRDSFVYISGSFDGGCGVVLSRIQVTLWRVRTCALQLKARGGCTPSMSEASKPRWQRALHMWRRNSCDRSGDYRLFLRAAPRASRPRVANDVI